MCLTWSSGTHGVIATLRVPFELKKEAGEAILNTIRHNTFGLLLIYKRFPARWLTEHATNMSEDCWCLHHAFLLFKNLGQAVATFETSNRCPLLLFYILG